MPIESCMSDLPPAILFDLDGTLIDSAPDLSAALNHTLRTLDIPEVPEESVRHMVGYGARRLIEQGIEAALIEMDDGEIEAALRIFLDWYRDHLADRTRPFEGVIDALDTLQAAQMPMAVCTNKPQEMSEKVISALGLSPYFSAIVGADIVPNRKPHADHVHATLKAMEAGSRAAIFVGDSATDVNAARNAGLPVIAVSFGYPGSDPKDLAADILIDHMRDLPDAIARLLR